MRFSVRYPKRNLPILAPRKRRTTGNKCPCSAIVLPKSGRKDSNLRPLGPKPSALARLSYAPDQNEDSEQRPFSSLSSMHRSPAGANRQRWPVILAGNCGENKLAALANLLLRGAVGCQKLANPGELFVVAEVDGDLPTAFGGLV